MLINSAFSPLRGWFLPPSVLLAALVLQACCAKDIKIPPRVDGVNITLENAQKGWYHLLVKFEGCELCDQDRDVAEEIILTSEELFALRVNEKLTNDQYNAFIESIQAKLMIARQTCNTYAIPDSGATYAGNTTKYTQSEKARDLSLRLQEALTHTKEVLAEAKQTAAGS